MAFNVGTTSKETFSKLKNLSLQKRMDAVKGQDAATILSMLTPTQFAELFPKYYQQGLPDVGGFREAVTRKSRQKQDDINFGLSQGAKTIEEAEQMGTWRRRFDSNKDAPGKTSSSFGGTYTAPANANDMQKAIVREANKLGISPQDLATMIHYESAGTMSPSKWGGKGGNYMGLIQFGPNERKQFGVREGQSFDEQMVSVGKFLEYRGLKSWLQSHPNASEQEKRYALYSTINAGRPDEKYWVRSDRPGYNVMRHVDEMFNSGHASYAKNLLTGTKLTPSDAAGSPGSAPDFSKYIMSDKMKGNCGVGTRTLAGHMFGNSYFLEKGIGEGGSIYAGSLSSGNRYFQSSGMYAPPKPGVSKDALTQDYLNGLPIGTVISSQGGSNGGHVQIKIGPNRWASDGNQGGNFYYGNSYSNFVVHEPNEAGLAELAKNGVVQPGQMPGLGPSSVTTAQDGQSPVAVAAQQTAAPAAPAPRQPEIPPEIPDNGQTATVSKPDKPAAKEKTFNVNRQELIGAIKQTDEFKSTFGSSLASDDMIYNGFFEHEKTKKLMADTQSSFDPNTGTVKIGNYDAFKKSIGMDTSKVLTEVASTVPSHAGGGRERVKGPLHVRHLHRERRGDTALVTDARGKQFTVNPQKEKMTVNPQTGIMDIKPVKAGDQMELEKLMAVIRRQESGSFAGDYTADLAAKKRKKGERHDTASGAYQYNNRTWQGVLKNELNMPQVLKQYPRAVSAPKEVQDQITRARFEKWRAAGYTDQQIILSHFTGNKEGKLSASAQKGNPTPAQYRAQMASHVAEYDKTYQPQQQPAKTDVAASGPITTQPAPQNESMASKLAAPLKGLLGPTSAAAEAVKAEPVPEAPKGEVSFAPAGMDENFFRNQQPAPQPRTELPPDRPQSPITMNPMENRPAHMQPTPSLARAMDNARGITNNDYTSLTGTKLGGK